MYLRSFWYQFIEMFLCQIIALASIAFSVETKSTGCACPYSLLPVCGKDGVTYDNECAMKCVGISKLYDGECVEQPCVCPLNIDPICGKDGKTYDNECLMNCASVSKKKKGPCKTEVLISEDETPVLSSADEPVCMCTFIYFPVCGADGVTYNNECLMTCHNVKMGYEGTCKS